MMELIDRMQLNIPEDCADYDELNEFAYSVAEAPTIGIPTWIPCSEKLPSEEKASYLICTDSGYMCECRWTDANPFWTHLKTDWHWNMADIPRYSKVIAWMPLPQPYREEE